MTLLARRRPPTGSPSRRECPNRIPAIGTAMALVSMKFPTAKLRRGSPDVCPRPGAARKIENYYVFPMGSGFCAVGQSRTPTAMVAANWRGCDVGVIAYAVGLDAARGFPRGDPHRPIRAHARFAGLEHLRNRDAPLSVRAWNRNCADQRSRRLAHSRRDLSIGVAASLAAGPLCRVAPGSPPPWRCSLARSIMLRHRMHRWQRRGWPRSSMRLTSY